MPLDSQHSDALTHDVDHLIGADSINSVRKIASGLFGLTKCDFYSATGERGTAYLKMPYLTPALAHEILKNRVIKEGVFYTPNPRDMFFAFAYHLVYHKGIKSGILSGLTGVGTYSSPPRQYGKELRRLAILANVNLPAELTLRSIHEFLKGHEWNMPFDLMVRWPDQHDVMRGLVALEQEVLASVAEMAKGITVFVIRDDCVGKENFSLVSDMLETRFSILEDVALTTKEATRIARLTRGGNWFEKRNERPVLPVHMFVYRQNSIFGPLPKGMTKKKISNRYPHLSHTDVLIKRDIRKAVNAQSKGLATKIILHATDNELESAETFQALKGKEVSIYLESLLELRHSNNCE